MNRKQYVGRLNVALAALVVVFVCHGCGKELGSKEWRANWDKVKVGMSVEQVRELLGTPNDVVVPTVTNASGAKETTWETWCWTNTSRISPATGAGVAKLRIYLVHFSNGHVAYKRELCHDLGEAGGRGIAPSTPGAPFIP